MPKTLNRRQLTQGGLAWLAGAPLFVRHALAADQARFTLGVASGQPRPDRLVLWTRLMGDGLPAEVPVAWQLAFDEAFTQIAVQGSELARADTAHSVHAEPAGLAPGRWYFYRFSALGQRSATGRTRTAPAVDAPATLRAALASCQRWEHGQYAAWRHVASQPHDLVVFVGDYIYEYPTSPLSVRPHSLPFIRTLHDYRARYALYKGDPALQAAHAACPWLMVWDDHEVANDYANDQSTVQSGADFLARRAAAYQAYWEHQPLPAAWRPRGADMRLHERFGWGRLAQIHALDGRQYRDHQACPRLVPAMGANTVDEADCPELVDPARSFLGVAQERWLDQGWDLQRRWNLLAQPTLMTRLQRQTEGSGRRSTPEGRSTRDGPGARYWTDGWDGYPAARQRLLSSASERGVANLVALGGDVHTNYVADLKANYDDPRAPVVGSDICGTSISSQGPAQARVDALRRLNPHVHHGRSDQRGYVSLHLDDKRLLAELMAVEQHDQTDSAVQVQARFVVAAGRPGPQPA